MDPTSPHFTPKSPIHVPKNPVPLPVRPAIHLRPTRESASPSPNRTTRILNCIVDDTALVQGAKESTRDGFRKWIARGQMRLFVPLCALAQISELKEKDSRLAKDAEQTLRWLDHATSTYPHLVTLQGGYDQYETWWQVERFLLPSPLFSPSPQDNSPTDTALKPQSPHEPSQSPDHPQCAPSTSSSTKTDLDRIDPELRPLINYTLWRIHQETNPSDALRNFIFVTDDPVKQKCAQRFGIRTKTLQDIRAVVAKENHATRSRDSVNTVQSAAVPDEDVGVLDSVSANGASESDGDEVLLKRSSNAEQVIPADSCATVVDPDQFSRALTPASRGSNNPRTTRGAGVSSRRGARGTASPRAGRAASCRSPAFVKGQRADSTTPLGSRLTNEQLKSLHSSPLVENTKPIDPDSFSRPSSAKPGATRGSRRLWNPV